MVKEFDQDTREEKQSQFFKGMEEDNAHEFDRRWESEIAPHMPRHSHGYSRGGMLQAGMHGRGSGQKMIMGDSMPGGQGRGPSSGSSGRMEKRALGYR